MRAPAQKISLQGCLFEDFGAIWVDTPPRIISHLAADHRTKISATISIISIYTHTCGSPDPLFLWLCTWGSGAVGGTRATPRGVFLAEKWAGVLSKTRHRNVFSLFGYPFVPCGAAEVVSKPLKPTKRQRKASKNKKISQNSMENDKFHQFYMENDEIPWFSGGSQGRKTFL